jgi:site-specific DNA-methyltransferase (adenine-specific)
MSSARTGTGRDDWQTPLAIVDRIHTVFGGIELDPCGAPDNPTRASVWWEANGLSFWDSLPGLIYVNPPYSQARAWLAHCSEYGGQGAEVLALVPARTDTRAWHDFVFSTAVAVGFVSGRLRFRQPGSEAPTNPAPFPSAFVYWGAREKHFRRFCDGIAKVVIW